MDIQVNDVVLFRGRHDQLRFGVVMTRGDDQIMVINVHTHNLQHVRTFGAVSVPIDKIITTINSDGIVQTV